MLLKKSLTVAATVAVSALALAPSAPAQVQIRTDLKPGDRVADGAIGAVVPPPGEFVRAAAARVDGPPETLLVMTESDGSVLVDARTAQSPVNDLVDEAWGTPSECEDGYYLRWAGADGRHWKWKTTMNWWFRAVSTPSDVDRDAAREEVRSAVRNVVTTRNDCGMTDQVSASQDFQGDTTAGTNIWWNDPQDWCGANDGKNVVGFGYLGERTAAFTCAWGHDDGSALLTIDNADTRLATSWDHQWYAGERPLICAYPYWQRHSVEAVMTSAFGFTYGLEYIWPGQADGKDHRNLTMSGGGPCDESPTTLAKGDILGLRSLY